MQHDPPEPDDDDALLAALAGVYREQEAAAEAAWPSTDPVFAPIEGDEAAALFNRVQAQTGAEAAPPQGAKILRFPTRRVVAAVTALAAGLLLFVFTRGPSGPPPLPGYALTTLSGDQANRADGPKTAKRAKYTPGSRVLLVARPSAAIQGKVSARLHVRQGGAAARIQAPVQVSAAGAVRIDLVAGDTLPMTAGDGELIILLVPDGLDQTDDALLSADDPSPAQRLVHPFTFTP